MRSPDVVSVSLDIEFQIVCTSSAKRREDAMSKKVFRTVSENIYI